MSAMSDTFKSHSQIIDAIGVAVLASSLDLPASHIRTMKTRESIPVHHWSKVIAACAAGGKTGVDEKLMANTAPEPKPRTKRKPVAKKSKRPKSKARAA